MKNNFIFTVLEHTDSTNNDAMMSIRDGKGVHGSCIFSQNQRAGKGQRGKTWQSEGGMNIAMSVLIERPLALSSHPFVLQVMVSVVCRRLLSEMLRMDFQIKWPNDLYVNDRKAGGILIENKYRGKEWQWAVVGIGINVNQTAFAPELTKAVSLRQLSGKVHEPEAIARMIHVRLLESIEAFDSLQLADWMEEYHRYFYKKGEKVLLWKNGQPMEATILGINEQGWLGVYKPELSYFSLGELSWEQPINIS